MSENRVLNKLSALALSILLTASALIGPQAVASQCFDVFTTLEQTDTAYSQMPESVRMASKDFRSKIWGDFAIRQVWSRDEGNLTQLRVLERETWSGEEKIRSYLKFGFLFDRKTKLPTHVPTWLEFADNYRRAMANKGLAPHQYIRPALVYYLGDESKPGGITDVKLVDPFMDEIPSAELGYKVHEATRTTFNLSVEFIEAGLAAGKFPLLGGVHDLAHFDAYVRNPEFSTELVAAFKKRPTGSAFRRRLFWLMEYSAFITPNREGLVREFLKHNPQVRGNQTRSERLARLEAMDRQSLISYAVTMSSTLHRSLSDLSGGSSGTWEMATSQLNLFDSEIPGGYFSGDEVFSSSMHLITGAINLHRTNFQGQPMSRPVFGQNSVNQGVYLYLRNIPFSIDGLAKALRGMDKQKLGEYLNRNWLGGIGLAGLDIEWIDKKSGELKLTDQGHEQLFGMLRDYVASGEVLLAASESIYLKTYVRSMLNSELRQSDPVAVMWSQIFPGFFKPGTFPDMKGLPVYQRNPDLFEEQN